MKNGEWRMENGELKYENYEIFNNIESILTIQSVFTIYHFDYKLKELRPVLLSNEINGDLFHKPTLILKFMYLYL